MPLYHPNQEKVLQVENTQIYANILAGKFLSLNSNEFSILMNNVKTLAGIIKFRVRALAGDIVLCSWARHLTLTVPLSIQEYKWVPANLMLG